MNGGGIRGKRPAGRERVVGRVRRFRWDSTGAGQPKVPEHERMFRLESESLKALEAKLAMIGANENLRSET